MTNWLITADLLYDKRPCQRISLLKNENYVILKSDARLACFPSFPTIPIPTFASNIIPTSLPPSPTAAVRLPVYWFIFFTISAFYVGLHLQTHTLGAIVADWKNISSIPLLLMHISRVCPSIINIFFSAARENFCIACSHCFKLVSSFIKNSCWCLDLKPALIAMQVAVSTLSPVNIQTWMPALLSDSMVMATSS